MSPWRSIRINPVLLHSIGTSQQQISLVNWIEDYLQLSSKQASNQQGLARNNLLVGSWEKEETLLLLVELLLLMLPQATSSVSTYYIYACIYKMSKLWLMMWLSVGRKERKEGRFNSQHSSQPSFRFACEKDEELPLLLLQLLLLFSGVSLRSSPRM